VRELKNRIEDLNHAIYVTTTAARNAACTYYRDLHLAAIEYYKKEIVIAESQLLVYANIKIDPEQQQ